MLQGKLSKVVSITHVDGFPFPTVAPPPPSSPHFSLDVSGYSTISSSPLVPDPYELCRVFVRESEVPGGGQGLFAKTELPAGAVVAFYNGVRFHDCHVSHICCTPYVQYLPA